MTPQSKVLDWGKRYSLADLYGDSRLEGFEVAIVESGIRGARMNLVATPVWAARVELETEARPSTG